MLVEPRITRYSFPKKEGGEGFKGPISISKNIEIEAASAAEAIEMVRKVFGNNAGKCRALTKPNTNFKIVL